MFLRRIVVFVLSVSAATLAAAHPPTGELPEGIERPSFEQLQVRMEQRSEVGIRVVGGAPSKDRQVVGIMFMQNGSQGVCSGLYISAKRILTAAHCTCGSSNYWVTNADFVEQEYQPAHLVSVFNQYPCGASNYLPRGDDLALLGIDEPLRTFEESTGQERATCSSYSLLPSIPREPYLLPNRPRNISVAGYGYSGPTADALGHRQSAVVSLDSVNCGRDLARAFGCTPFLEFIAGATRRNGIAADTCGGDSGGPAFFETGGGFVPIGIVSRALPVRHQFSHRACGAGGIYSHLNRSDVIAWLRANGVGDGGGDPLCRRGSVGNP